MDLIFCFILIILPPFEIKDFGSPAIRHTVSLNSLHSLVQTSTSRGAHFKGFRHSERLKNPLSMRKVIFSLFRISFNYIRINRFRIGVRNDYLVYLAKLLSFISFLNFTDIIGQFLDNFFGFCLQFFSVNSAIFICIQVSKTFMYQLLSLYRIFAFQLQS